MTDDNVRPLTQKAKSKGDGKPPKADAYLQLSHCLNRDIVGRKWPEFPVKYFVAKLDEGQRLILRELEDEIVIASNRLEVAGDILRYVAPIGGLYAFELKHAKDCVDYWTHWTPGIIPMPPHFLWADEPGLTFRRLPWARGAEGPTPTWDSFLKRLSNARAFRRWIGALFVPESTHQQYVWVHGQGGEGKGAIDRFLKGVMGKSYRAEEPPTNQFWTYGLIGARLVSFTDCNNTRFVSGGKFKSLCANDAIRCEAKGGGIFSMNLNCRFIFFSNERPHLSTERADMRRVIYCEFEDRPETEEDDPEFEKLLWAEGGAFLTKCIREYRESNPKHGPIKSDNEEIKGWATSMESHLENIFKDCFYEHKYTDLPVGHKDHIPDRDKKFCTSEQFAASLAHYVKDAHVRAEFYAWLARVKKIKYRQVRLDNFDNGARAYRYVGITPKLL